MANDAEGHMGEVCEAICEAQPDTGPDAPRAASRRFAKRRTTQTRAYILQNERMAPIGCVVRDISSTGALLELTNKVGQVATTTAQVPPTFTLRLPIEFVEMDCVVVRRDEFLLGVRFASPSRMLPRPPRAAPKTDPKPKGVFGRLRARD